MDTYMNALFSIGQKVVCVDSGGEKLDHIASNELLIEGKTYIIIENLPCRKCGRVFVNVGIKNPHNVEVCYCGDESKAYGYYSHLQTRFVPLEFDRQADGEIFESLKGSKIYLHKEPKEY